MTHAEGTFGGAGGLGLFYQCWCPEETARSAVALVHGIGEHSGRYPHLVVQLVPRGHAVYGFDHRGHGRSPGQRGHIGSWGEYREDVGAFVSLVRGMEPGRPVFLFAHSMGALIALDYLPIGQQLLTGAVISGAPIAPVGVAKPLLVVLAKFLSRVWPTFTLRTQLDATAISRDPEVVRAYRADPLVHGVATARWGAEGIEAVRRVRVSASRITLPVLFIHGGADRLNAASGIPPYVEQLSSVDKTVRIYPDAFHEPHNDLDQTAVVEDVVEWIESRVISKP